MTPPSDKEQLHKSDQVPKSSSHGPTQTQLPTPEVAPVGGTVTFPVPDHTITFDPAAAPLEAEPRSELRVPTIPGYEILGLLGRGGMGVVYKARHLALKRTVALKMMHGGGHAGPQHLARFRVEAEAVARLQHPNIVQIHEVGEHDGHPYCSLEFVEGGTLAEKLARRPVTPREAARLVETLARAVQLAHSRNVVHRDLKPANILLALDGTPKVTDFGLARQLDSDSGETQAGAVMGTPSYTAPEQAAGHSHGAGPAADIYALGAILYDCLAGRPPFKGGTVVETLDQVRTQEPTPPSRWRTGVPLDLETICLKCLRKEPENRYASAAGLANDLGRFLRGEPVQARPITRLERTWRWCRRNPAAVVVAGVFIAAFVMVCWSYYRAEDALEEQTRQRQAANDARDDAERKEKAERWERYRANMIAAGSAMQLHNVSAARGALDAAPEEHRNWEWRYFYHQLDTSQHVIRLGDGVNRIEVSPDGTRAAVQSNTGPARLWDLETRTEIGVINNLARVRKFEFSPDRKTLACKSQDEKSILIWDTAAGREQAVLNGVQGQITRMQFSPDGKRLVAGSRDQLVHVWDTTTGKQVFALSGHRDLVEDAKFSPDGKRIASAGLFDRTVRLWDAETGQPLSILGNHSGEVFHLVFNPAGDRILAAEHYPSNVLRLWDPTAGKLVREMVGHTNGPGVTAFSPDGTRIASGGLDQTVRFWDGRTGEPRTSREGHSGMITSIAFSPDGTRVVSAAKDQTTRLWDAATGTPLSVLHGHTGPLETARYTPDGQRIITHSSSDGTIRLWAARTAEQNGFLRGHEDFVYGVAFHPDGERVASASWDGTVRVWTATAGRQLSRLSYPVTPGPNSHEDRILSWVGFHPDGQLVAAFNRRGVVRFWDLKTEQEVFQLRLPAGNVYSNDAFLAFNASGKLLAVSGGNDNAVHVFNVDDRTEVAVLRGHTSPVNDICFSPDGVGVATAGVDRTIRTWNLRYPQDSHTFGGHTGEIRTLAVSPDGKWLVSGGLDGTARLWDTSTWKAVATLKHGTDVYGLAFSPDGTRLASACANGFIRLWDTRTLQLVAELQGHGAYVHQIAWSPDGTRLVSGSGDKTVRVWDSLSVPERAERK